MRRKDGGSRLVTRKDIADRLGVSVSVVSRALNNSGYVEAGKKAEILHLARELGYQREPAALRDAARESRQVLVYTANTRNPFYAEMHMGICDVLRSHGYSMLLDFRPSDGLLRRYEADGCIFINELIAQSYLSTIGRNDYRPMVCAAFGSSQRLPSHVVMVESDLWAGARNMLDYLRRRGHTRIAMASPYPRNSQDARTLSWVASMAPVLGRRIQDYYLEVSEAERNEKHEGSLVGGAIGIAGLTSEDFFENGGMAAEKFVRSGCDATAVLCFNEEMGVGFLKALRLMGVKVPDQLSVAAYDGTYLRRYFDSPLTVLDLKPYLMGRRCAECLVKMMRGEKVQNSRVVPSQILEGATVRNL